MKKAQNLPKTKPRTLSIKISNSQIEDKESIRPKKDNSIPKFNRKTENKPFSRKKSETRLEVDQPLCYISPKRTNRQGTQFFRSPKFQDVALNFSAVLFQPSTGRDSEQGKSTKMSSSAVFQTDIMTKDQLRKDVTVYEMEVDSLREQVKLLQEQNKELRNKLNELESLQSFLIQRQTYIYQLTSSNTKLTEELTAITKIKENLQQDFQTFKKELKEKAMVFDQDFQKLQSKYDTQQIQLNLLLKSNLKLKEEIKNLKSNEKKGSLKRFSKENSQNFNRKSQRNLTKSKSALFKTAPIQYVCPQVDELNISAIDHKSGNGGNETVTQLTEMLGEESMLLFENVMNKTCHCQKERDAYHQTIKKLKTKIRYSEIQIDILKKIKVDSDKIKEENTKLKVNNRKLLNRIDFISRETKKRRCNCDSSLELSLSPAKM